MSPGEKFYLAVVLVTFLGFMGMLAVHSARHETQYSRLFRS